MAVDPALVAFDVLNTSRDTLLNYVMANRRMQQQDRQFNTQMQLQRDQMKDRRDRFDIQMKDSRDRFDINTGFRTRAEQDALAARKADKAFASSLLREKRSKEEFADYNRRMQEYANIREKGELNPFKDEEDYKEEFRQMTPEFPVYRATQLPSFYSGLPSFGLDYLLRNETNPEQILLNANMQSLIQKGQ
tara:strand:+ start:314 stop:886 length:573 start_codon:yes stop_codon:yes gene_type:complete